MDPLLSRQPLCGLCGHEDHNFFACDWCLCGSHLPVGVYPKEET